MAWLYILECSDGSFYVGSTIDLERRVAQHKSGEGAVYTRSRRPLKLVFSQEFQRLEEAFLREKQVQGWNRAKRLALIEGRFQDLPILALRKSPNPQKTDEFKMSDGYGMDPLKKD
ncbi:MAG: GIY-YIG nuclease family protein [Fibrobacteria bacterium]|nr:GIY-YIG nuclease family protein [Fibrobacteria bacterium]